VSNFRHQRGVSNHLRSYKQTSYTNTATSRYAPQSAKQSIGTGVGVLQFSERIPRGTCEKSTMSLNILLDKPGPYYPGATITGHVELRSSSDEAIAYIDINFTGRCKVKIRKHDHYTTVSYRSRGYYFSQHLSLYAEGKYKHKAGTYTWPFTFAIPDQASRQPVLGLANTSKTPTSWRPQRQLSATGVLRPGVGHELEGDMFAVKPPFRASALNALQAHPLPDSFAYAHSGFPADFEGRVESLDLEPLAVLF